MFKELLDYVNDHVIEIEPSTYEIVPNNQRFNSLANNLKRLVILSKEEYVQSGKELGLEDLYLVRANEHFPEFLKYKSYKNNGRYVKVGNPLFAAIEYDNTISFNLAKETAEKTELVCPVDRNTVHYSINGLTSDTYNFQFTDRECIVIEPFKEKESNSRMVNINPVDTFIDVKDQDEPISEDAIYIFSKQFYNNLSEEIKDKIRNNKKYIFDPEKFVVNKKAINNLLQTTITDFVLCHNGILPIHSHGQGALWVETYEDYDINNKSVYYSDDHYLKMFQDLIEKISMERFGISYYNADEELKEVSGIYQKRNYYNHFPGVLHIDTKYYSEEKMKTIQNQKELIDKYLLFLKDKMGFSNELVSLIEERVNIVFQNASIFSFPVTVSFPYSLCDKIKEYINLQTLSKFVEVTAEFNKEEIRRLESVKMMSELGYEASYGQTSTNRK